MNLQERRDRKARQEKAEAALAIEQNAEDLGRQFYKQFPTLMLVEVAREGWKQFNDSAQSIAFLRGYTQARLHHDDYKRGK